MAPIIASRMCIPSMIQNKTGMIICTTSSAAYAKFGLPGQGGMAMHYPITKIALNRFVQLLGQEMEEYKIPVIALDPGGVLTERIEHEVKGRTGAAAPVLTRRCSNQWTFPRPPWSTWSAPAPIRCSTLDRWWSRRKWWPGSIWYRRIPRA